MVRCATSDVAGSRSNRPAPCAQSSHSAGVYHSNSPVPSVPRGLLDSTSRPTNFPARTSSRQPVMRCVNVSSGSAASLRARSARCLSMPASASVGGGMWVGDRPALRCRPLPPQLLEARGNALVLLDDDAEAVELEALEERVHVVVLTVELP